MSLTEEPSRQVAEAARASFLELSRLPASARDEALACIHQVLEDQRETILAANGKDLELATNACADGTLSQSILKRLDLGRKGKYDDMLQGILDVKNLEDPSMAALLRQNHARFC